VTTVLAIDHRITGVSAVVVDAGGEVLGTSARSMRLRHLPGGRVEQDPRDLLASTVHAGRAAMAEAGVPIDVVALAPQGDCVLAWDQRSGRPLSNLIVRPDRRAEKVRADLSEREHLISERTGLALNPAHPVVKLAWLRRHVTTDGVVSSSDSWLLHQLTGEFVTEVSVASRCLLADPRTLGWDLDLLGLLGLADQQMPAVLPSDRIIGTTIAFGGTVLVGGVVSNRTAVLAGEGCVQPAEAICAFGSGADLLANAGASATNANAGLTSSVAWRVKDETTYCIGGQVDAAASAVQWMKQLGFITSLADLDRVAAPDAGGVLAVPALGGLGAPWWRPGAKAHVSGMTRFTTVGHLVVAILQGVAAQIAALGSTVAVDIGQPLSRLRVGGNLTGCTTLMQALADLMQLDVEVRPTAHTAALGAAVVARIAVNPALSLSEAIRVPEPSTVFTPRWSSDQAIEFCSRWAEAAKAA